MEFGDLLFMTLFNDACILTEKNCNIFRKFFEVHTAMK